MSLSVLMIILVAIFASTMLAVWLMLRKPSKPKTKGDHIDDLTDQAEDDVEHIFNDEFREELRNRGRLHFEKIIGENAMFLQQDLRLTTSQLNDFMKNKV